jgi:hypothetical protein
MLKASCLCGHVAYEIDGPITNGRFCHCTSCRKFSGAPYSAWGLVQTSQFRSASTDAQLTRYDSGNGLRVSCSACGSPVWYEPKGLPQYLGIPLGIIDSGDVPTPAMHVWVKSKVPWLTISDSLPQYNVLP